MSRSRRKRLRAWRWRAHGQRCPCGGEAFAAHVAACPLSIDPESYPF